MAAGLSFRKTPNRLLRFSEFFSSYFFEVVKNLKGKKVQLERVNTCSSKGEKGTQTPENLKPVNGGKKSEASRLPIVHKALSLI